MLKRAMATAAFFLAAASLNAQAGTLSIGDAAPKLAVKAFVKGSPVYNFEKGKTYVVEFWATWCGPCRVSIPHLTELQKKHKKVTFIGVSVWEQDQGEVKPFVDKMGDKMDYRVAMDSVPAGKTGNDGKMAQNWMKAADQGGIPTAFIINKDSKIAWIGHPMEMEGPLDKVVAGKWNIQQAVEENKKAEARKQKMQALSRKLRAAQQSGDPAKLVEVVDSAIQENPELEMNLGMLKFNTLIGMKDQQDKAEAYGNHLLEKVLKDNAMALNAFAWPLVDPDSKTKVDARFQKLALAAAQRADELEKGKNPAVADTLGAAYFANGDAAKALEAQERAVQYAKGTEFEKDETIKARLEQYRKAAKQ